MYKIKVTMETRCISLSNEEELIDYMFFDSVNFDRMTISDIEFQASKLAAVNDVDVYELDTTEFRKGRIM